MQLELQEWQAILVMWVGQVFGVLPEPQDSQELVTPPDHVVPWVSIADTRYLSNIVSQL